MIHALAQAAGFLAVLAGVFLLLGMAWTLIIGGACLAAASVAIELRRHDRAPTTKD